MMSRVGTIIDVLVISARHQMAVVRAHPLFLISGAVQPAVLLLIMFFARGRPAGEQVTTVATAVLLMSYWGVTVWQGGTILRRERNLGTLGASLRGVQDPMLVLTGKSLGASLAPVMLAAVTIAVGLGLLQAPLVVASPGWFIVGVLAAMVSGTALGILLCSLFLLTRFGPQLSSALLYPVFLLAGLLIPPGFFPAAISWLGWFVPLRWAQQFLVSAARGTPDFPALGVIGLLTVVYAVVGTIMFRRIEFLARARGTLELG